MFGATSFVGLPLSSVGDADGSASAALLADNVRSVSSILRELASVALVAHAAFERTARRAEALARRTEEVGARAEAQARVVRSLSREHHMALANGAPPVVWHAPVPLDDDLLNASTRSRAADERRRRAAPPPDVAMLDELDAALAENVNWPPLHERTADLYSDPGLPRAAWARDKGASAALEAEQKRRQRAERAEARRHARSPGDPPSPGKVAVPRRRRYSSFTPAELAQAPRPVADTPSPSAAPPALLATTTAMNAASPPPSAHLPSRTRSPYAAPTTPTAVARPPEDVPHVRDLPASPSPYFTVPAAVQTPPPPPSTILRRATPRQSNASPQLTQGGHVPVAMPPAPALTLLTPGSTRDAKESPLPSKKPEKQAAFSPNGNGGDMMSELQSRLKNMKATGVTDETRQAKKKENQDTHSALMDQIKLSEHRLRRMTLSYEPKKPKKEGTGLGATQEEPSDPGPQQGAPGVASLLEKVSAIRQAQYSSDEDSEWDED